METSKLSGERDSPSTELGNFLRSERALRGIRRAKDMADEMGISNAHLSKVETGKNDSMDIDFLLKCRDFLGLRFREGRDEEMQEKMGKTFELFYKGFVSSHKNISLDMKYFQGNRKILLAKIIVALFFMPDDMAVKIDIRGKKDVVDYAKAVDEVKGMVTDAMRDISSYVGLQIKNWDSPVSSKKST